MNIFFSVFLKIIFQRHSLLRCTCMYLICIVQCFEPQGRRFINFLYYYITLQSNREDCTVGLTGRRRGDWGSQCRGSWWRTWRDTSGPSSGCTCLCCQSERRCGCLLPPGTVPAPSDPNPTTNLNSLKDSVKETRERYSVAHMGFQSMLIPPWMELNAKRIKPL